MKRYEAENLKVVSLNGHSGLMTRSQTLEDLRAEIARIEARAVEQGYKAEKWLIVCEEVYTYYEDDGTFSRREVYENVVEQYPQGLE